jgi:formate/nitrite transporter FocA (FNT family)
MRQDPGFDIPQPPLDVARLIRQIAGDRADYVMLGIAAGVAIGLLTVAMLAAATERR